jgi:hypothetical protein
MRVAGGAGERRQGDHRLGAPHPQRRTRHPAELASRFKFARQKSKLAGTIRGSYFAFKTDPPRS